MIELSISLPPDFLEEEVRCDYIVTKQAKEVWAVELDLLHQLDSVCKKNNIRYFAGAGTLLGAIRHKGFIPWDDDIDIYMLRPDYDKLMQLADEFSEPYFLHSAYTDQNLMRTFARLRNTHTTFATDWDTSHDAQKGIGIFIDIFPLDGVSENFFQNLLQKEICHYYRVLFSDTAKYNPNWSFRKNVCEIIKRVFFGPFRGDRFQNYKKYEEYLKKYSVEGTRIWGNRTIIFNCPKSRRPIEDWMDIIETPFEFTSIPIPRNFDEILKQQYGDYMIFPEDKDSGKWHQAIEISTDFAFDDPRRTIK